MTLLEEEITLWITKKQKRVKTIKEEKRWELSEWWVTMHYLIRAHESALTCVIYKCPYHMHPTLFSTIPNFLLRICSPTTKDFCESHSYTTHQKQILTNISVSKLLFLWLNIYKTWYFIHYCSLYYILMDNQTRKISHQTI